MTLIVCKNIGGNVEFQSDTRIWDDLAQKRDSALQGKLKALVIRPDVCIAYAGNERLAQRAVAQARTQLAGNDGTSVAEGLRIASNDGVDFILATIASGRGRISLIKDGAIDSDLSTAWIGDISAFTCFQHYWIEKSLQTETPQQQSGLFIDAFDHVIDSDLDTVGDFRIGVKSDLGYFQYQHYVGMFFPNQNIGPGETTLVLGDATTGGYAVSCLPSTDRDRPGVALYLQPGRIGVLLVPQGTFDMIPLHDMDVAAFVAHVRSHHAVPIHGLVNLLDGNILCV